MSKELRNRCKSDLSLNRRGREKELFPLARVNNKSTNSAVKKKEKKKKKKKNPHVAQIKELARYVWSQVGVTGRANKMFNDPKSAMKAGHHRGAPTST